MYFKDCIYIKLCKENYSAVSDSKCEGRLFHIIQIFIIILEIIVAHKCWKMSVLLRDLWQHNVGNLCRCEKSTNWKWWHFNDRNVIAIANRDYDRCVMFHLSRELGTSFEMKLTRLLPGAYAELVLSHKIIFATDFFFFVSSTFTETSMYNTRMRLKIFSTTLQ